MANKFRPKNEDIPVGENPLKKDKSKKKFFLFKPKKEFSDAKSEKEFSDTEPKKEFPESKPKKHKSTAPRQIRKGFNAIFGGGILKKINFEKNWPYFLMLTSMIIVLIYNSLNMQSKKIKIESLKDEIVHANDVLMDVIEEGYVIDEEQDKALSELAKEEGFINKGYMPYIIREDEE